jgi:surface protein
MHDGKILVRQGKVRFVRSAAFSVEVATTTTPQDFKLYLAGASSLKITWGDTSENTYTGSDGVKTHSYATPGNYTITFVSGTATQIAFGESDCTPTLLTAVLTATPVSLGLTSAKAMFKGCQNITAWAANFFDSAVVNVTSLEEMFMDCNSFNEDISGWNISNVTSLRSVFYNCLLFNRDIGNWNTAKVTDMAAAFGGCWVFNQDLGSWNLSAAIDIGSMFDGAYEFNQDISGWDVSNVTDMDFAFSFARKFNQDIGGWITSSLVHAQNMFQYTNEFNQNLNDWDTSKVTNAGGMFQLAKKFNGLVSSWDMSSCTNMQAMFYGASVFNQSLSGWVTSSVTDMSYMFDGASLFNQDISGFDVTNLTDATQMLKSSAFGQTNYDLLLVAWAAQAVKNSVTFDAGSAHYSAGAPTTAHDHLTGTHSWTIYDGGTP